MAFHDDVYVVTLPHRVAHSFSVVQEQFRRHSNIRVHLGKIKVWNVSGVEPRACQILQRIADASGDRESVWKGSGLPTELQGIKVMGTPLGHPDFVAAHLDRVLSDHRTLLERIQLCRTSSVRGLCSFTVHVAGPTTKSELSDRHSRRLLPWGDACARFSGCLWTQESSPETLLPCPYRCVGWDFGAQSDPGSPPIGQVGLTPSPWSG